MRATPMAEASENAQMLAGLEEAQDDLTELQAAILLGASWCPGRPLVRAGSGSQFLAHSFPSNPILPGLDSAHSAGSQDS